MPRKLVPLLSDARYKGIHGGRASSKSHFFAERLIEECIAEHTRAVCIREIQKSIAESSKKLLENKIIHYGLGHLFDVKDTYIKGPHGSEIIFQGMQNHTAESIKSLEAIRIAWVDEAHRISATSWDLLRPTIRAPGSQIWCSWNPTKPTDPIDAFFRGARKHPSMICVEANYTDNPFLPAEMLAEMEFDRETDPDKYKHVWLGGYRKVSAARVFKRFRIAHVPAPPPDTILRFGADWGFATDPTTLVCCYIVGRTLYVWRELYAVGVEIDETPAFFDQIDPERPKLARDWAILADSARPETISYMRRNGYPLLRAAKKGPGSVEDGVEFLKGYEIVVDPSCVNAYNELCNYEYKTDKLSGEIVPILKDETNHVIDALRYAVETARRKEAGVF